MALKILNPGTHTPMGQFDAYDTDLSTAGKFKGGEVATFRSVNIGTDQSAMDVTDGYSGTTTKVRPAVTTTLPTAALSGPFFLTDDGTVGYGTLFGSIVGGTVGQQTSGTVLGPHTATGSGKITLWAQEGLYGVTLDALDTASLNPTIAIAPSTALTATAADGRLGLGGTANAGVAMARFVEYATDGSLVRTPNSLVSGLNSPTSDVSSVQQKAFTMAIIYWLGN